MELVCRNKFTHGEKVSECQVLITTEKACKKRYVTDGSTGNLIKRILFLKRNASCVKCIHPLN